MNIQHIVAQIPQPEQCAEIWLTKESYRLPTQERSSTGARVDEPIGKDVVGVIRYRGHFPVYRSALVDDMCRQSSLPVYVANQKDVLRVQ